MRGLVALYFLLRAAFARGEARRCVAKGRRLLARGRVYDALDRDFSKRAAKAIGHEEGANP